MKLRPAHLLSLSLLLLAALFAGCTSRSTKESSIPWSQPATWEGQIPGMTPQQ